MRTEDRSVEPAVKEIASLLAAGYQRYVNVVRLAAKPPEDDLDNQAESSPHVVDTRRTRR